MLIFDLLQSHSCNEMLDVIVWLNAPFAKLDLFIKHYLKRKAAAYQLLPVFLCLSGRESGANFWEVCSCSGHIPRDPSSSLLLRWATVSGGSLVQRPWDIEVWDNPPAAPMRLSTLPDEQQPWLMTFPVYVVDHSAKTLADGGATHKYIDAAFAAAKGLKFHKCSGRLLAAFVRIRIQSLSEEVKLYVIDLPGKEMHAVLGQSWLLHHNAVMSYADKCVLFHAGGYRGKLKCNPNAPALKPLLQKCPALLTRMQLQNYAQGERQPCFPC